MAGSSLVIVRDGAGAYLEAEMTDVRKYRVTLSNGDKAIVESDNNWNARIVARRTVSALKLFGVHIEAVDRIDMIDGVENDKPMNRTVQF